MTDEDKKAEAEERAAVNWREMTTAEVIRKDEEITNKYYPKKGEEKC